MRHGQVAVTAEPTTRKRAFWTLMAATVSFSALIPVMLLIAFTVLTGLGGPNRAWTAAVGRLLLWVLIGYPAVAILGEGIAWFRFKQRRYGAAVRWSLAPLACILLAMVLFLIS